jgi:hypothetical protein
MIESFYQFGVTADMIKKRIQCHVEAIRPAQMVQLKKIFASIRDGMSKASDWFEVEPEGGDINDKINAAVAETEEKEEAPGKSQQNTQENSSTKETLIESSAKSEENLPPWHPDNHKGKRWQGLIIFAKENIDTWDQASDEHQTIFLKKWADKVSPKDICPVSKRPVDNAEIQEGPGSEEEEVESNPVVGEDGRKIDFYKYHIDAANSKVTLNQFVEEFGEAVDDREDANEIWDIWNSKLELVSDPN